jgi:sulfide:quinone oxidoreductase
LPRKAEWIKQKVVAFDPDRNKLTTSTGDEISYEFLVVAMGLQLNYHEVMGYLHNPTDFR